MAKTSVFSSLAAILIGLAVLIIAFGGYNIISNPAYDTTRAENTIDKYKQLKRPLTSEEKISLALTQLALNKEKMSASARKVGYVALTIGILALIIGIVGKVMIDRKLMKT